MSILSDANDAKPEGQRISQQKMPLSIGMNGFQNRVISRKKGDVLTTKVILQQNRELVKRLIEDGNSVNQIMRVLRCTADHTLRRWIKENLPEFVEKLRENGDRRKKCPSKC